MAYVLRKFQRSKWDPEGDCPEKVEDLGADAFTSCLRTSGNTLSVWEAKTPEWGDFEDVLAALFTTFERPNKADVVLLDDQDVQGIEGVSLENNAGKTIACSEVNEKHWDISNLKYPSMVSVAELILKEIQKGEDNPRVKRFVKKEVLFLVDKKATEKVIDESRLNKYWKEDIEKLRASRGG